MKHARRRQNQALKLNLYLEEPLLSSEAFPAVEKLVLTHHARGGILCRLGASEHTLNRTVGAEQSVRLAANEIAAELRLNRTLAILSADEEVRLFCSYSKATHVADSNRITIDVDSLDSMEIQHSVWSLLLSLSARFDIRYANAHTQEEFEHKNVDSSNGAKAVGVDLADHLPAVYWMNYFGRRYLPLLGEADNSLAFRHCRLEHGLLLQAYPMPEDWNLPDSRIASQKLTESLGAEFFFDRSAPQRRTRAPDFFAPPPQNGPAK